MIFDWGAFSENNRARAALLSCLISLFISLLQSPGLSPKFSIIFSSFLKEVSGSALKIIFADSPTNDPAGLIFKTYSSLGFIGLIGQGMGSFIFLSKLAFLDHRILPSFLIDIWFKGSGEKIKGLFIEILEIWLDADLSNKKVGVNKHKFCDVSLSP